MVDFNKPVYTKDGRKVRILATDIRGVETPIVAAVCDKNEDKEYLYSYTKEGSHNFDIRLNLTNASEETVEYGNIYFSTDRQEVVLFTYKTYRAAVFARANAKLGTLLYLGLIKIVKQDGIAVNSELVE